MDQHEWEVPIDVLLMVVFSAIWSIFMLYYMIPIMDGKFGGFDTTLEKTAVHTTGELAYPEKDKISNADVLLVVAVADRHTALPGKMTINGIDVPLRNYISGGVTHNFEAERVAMIQRTFGALNWSAAENTWELVSGPDGKMTWRFK